MPAAAESAHSAADSVERATYSAAQTVTESSAVARTHQHLALRADGIQTGIHICRCLIGDLLGALNRRRLVADLLSVLNCRSGNSVVDVGRADRGGSSIR